VYIKGATAVPLVMTIKSPSKRDSTMIGASHHFLRALIKSHIIAVFDLAILNPREKLDRLRLFQLWGDVNRALWPILRVARAEAKLATTAAKGEFCRPTPFLTY
jgi:hypothetical protein